MTEVIMKKMLTLIIFCLSIIASTAYANSIKLYEQPKDSSHVIRTLKAGTQLLPIYYPKQGDWIKVANPKNGDVGWVKINELNGKTTTNGIVGTQKVIVKPGQGYQVYQQETTTTDASAPEAIDPEQVQQMMNQMQQKTTQMQQSMQEVLNSMVQQINAMQKTFGTEDANDHSTQPVIVVPDNKE